MWFILRELKKSSLRTYTLLLLIICLLLINGVMLTEKIELYNADTTSDFRAGYNDVYNRVEGAITIENMNWIISEKNRLNELIISGQFSTEACQDTTYTGYVYSDNNLINELYDDAKYACDYENYAKNIELKAIDASRIYSEKGNKELSEKYNAIFVPLYDEFQKMSEKFGAEHFALDCIHPTPAGYELIARRWMECCKEILNHKI